MPTRRASARPDRLSTSRGRFARPSLAYQFECLLHDGEIWRQGNRRSHYRRRHARRNRTRDVPPLTLAQSCVSLRVVRGPSVVPCFSGFAPVHLRMLQVIRRVAVIRSRPRFICAERGHCRSEQPYQCAPTGLRQSLLNGAAPARTALTGGNADLGSACPKAAPRRR